MIIETASPKSPTNPKNPNPLHEQKTGFSRNPFSCVTQRTVIIANWAKIAGGRTAFGPTKSELALTGQEEKKGYRVPPATPHHPKSVVVVAVVAAEGDSCGKRNGRNPDQCTENRPATENDYHSHFLSKHCHPSAHHHNYRARYRRTIPRHCRAYRTAQRRLGEIVPRESFVVDILLWVHRHRFQ
jgi:hypothetical protein